MDFIDLFGLMDRRYQQATDQVLESLQSAGQDVQQPEVIHQAQQMGLMLAVSHFLVPVIAQCAPTLFEQWHHDAERVRVENDPGLAAKVRHRLEQLYRQPDENGSADESRGS